MESEYLIDTNCIIDFAKGNLPDQPRIFLADVIDERPSISVINKIEVLGFSNPGEGIIQLMNEVNVIDLSNDIVEATIQLRKKYKTKLPDAIIAATALQNNLTLLTRNISDFKMIEGLKLIDPWEPEVQGRNKG